MGLLIWFQYPTFFIPNAYLIITFDPCISTTNANNHHDPNKTSCECNWKLKQALAMKTIWFKILN
jgi:hypothetical protein